MAQNIEIPVSLGLLNALSQVADLRKMLLDSVNVKSDAFKDILRFLDKISGLADALKGKMGEAFKTPSGSKNFLKQYEQLMGMLETARDKFTNLGLNDIAFSADDQASVDKTIEKIKSLQTEIANLEKGKIGNLFDDKSILGADKVTAFIEQLKSTGQDVSKLTFSGLSTAINRELSAVNTKIQETTERISGFKALINTLSGTSLDNITTKMEQALTSATDPAKSTFKTEKLIEYRNAVADFYKEWDLLGVLHNAKNDTTGNVSTWLQKESLNIANGAENLKALLPKCQAALLLLQEIKDNPALKGDEAKGKVLNIAESLGLTNFNADSFRSYTSAIAELRRKILEELMHGFTSDKEVDQYAEQMIAHLGQAFENIDINKVVNVTNLRNLLKAIFTEAGLDLRDSDLSRIINSLGENMDFSAFISNAQQAFLDFIKKRQEMVDESEKQNETLKQLLDDLQTASNTVQTLDNIKTDSIKLKEAEVQQFTLSLQELINKYNEANGTRLKVVDDSLFKNGLSAITSYIDSLTKLQLKQKALSNVQMAVNRWMGFWQVLNMTKSAINDMKQHIQELDTVMTSISVVTNFSLDDLWGQISQYSEIARQYGVAIKGVYEVSLIYYQQGLQLNDVMTLTTETLKMARIAGLDYATAADYMTTAIRGFKLEMTDAAHVTDVFSALAATTASSTEEIATAISKTAASAEAVGASFEATSAMMATMIATTRESATNIGTALKSVISRYGEMTSDPSKTVDSEGEEMSLNRVDKALLTVGITLHDTAGLFRDFDDVMLELMEKWDSLDSLSLRYIATLMAGNRQQSRFLALVSNVDEYKKALETAMNSEGTGELLTLKTLDSIDAKIEKMKVTIQEFYTSSGIEELYKNVIDTITNIISAANSLPKAFNKFPARALAVGMSLITTVKSVLTLIIAEILLGLEKAKGTNTNFLVGLVLQYTQKGREAGLLFSNGVNSGLKGFVHSKAFVLIANIVGAAAQLIGSGIFTQGLSKYGASTSHDEDMAAVGLMRTGAVVSAVGGIASGAAMGFAAAGPLGALAGGVTALITQIPTLRTAFELNTETLARKIELDKKAETKAKEELSKDKGEQKGLENALDLLNKLKAALYDSAEAAKEYTDYMNLLGDLYPHLIESLDQAGNSIISVTSLEEALAEARAKTASSTITSLEKELERLKDEQEAARRLGDFNTLAQDTDFSNLLLEYFGETAARGKTKGQNYKMANLVTAYLEDTGLSTKKEKTYNAVRLQTDASELNARDYLSSPRQRQAVMDWAIEYYSSTGMEMDSAILEPLLSLLYSKVNDYITALPESNLLKFLKLDNVNQINSMGGSQLIELSKRIKQYSTDIFDSTALTLETVDSALVNAQISSNVQSRLNAMATSEEQKKKDNAATLLNYLTLMSFIYSSMDNYEQSMEGLEQWILSHESDALKLLSIDYSNFKDSTEIDFYGLDEIYLKAFINQFNKIREDSIELYTNLLNNILGEDWEDNYEWLKADNFNNKTLTTILSNFKQYQSLIEKQLYAQAEAYFNSIKAIYGESGLGGLKGLLQTEAFDIIKDLDLSDPEALRSAAETFAEMGPEFAGLSKLFTNTALRWTTSAATLLEQLASSTKDTAKSIESSTSDMSKVFKYSEALEKAQALMDANEGVKFDELFTFDKDLGGYIKTAKAFSLEMAEFLKTSYDAVLRSITDNLTILPLIDSVNNTIKDQYLTDIKNESITGDRSRYAKLQFEQRLKAILPEASDADLDRLWSEYTAMVDAFEAQTEDEKEDWNTFTQKYLQERGSDLVDQLEEILKMPQRMAKEALLSFDFASIASGKGTAQSKETFKALLTQATSGRLSEQASGDLFDLLLKGEVARFNSMMHSLGLDDLQVDKGQANRARFEGLTSLYDKIASGDVVWDALTEQEQELLNSVEGVNLTKGASAQQVGAAADNVWAAIIKLILAGAGTLDEVANSLLERAEKDYLATNVGKQYDLLTKLSDGFTADEITSFTDELGKHIFTDEQGNLDSEFSKYFEFRNNKWMIAAGQDAAAVIEYLAEKLGISIDDATEEYKKIISDSIDEEIKKADEADTGKLRVEKLSKIMSGKVTDRISLAGYDDIDKAYLKAAGLITDSSANFVYILSEELLNNAIKYFDSLLSNETWTKNNPQTARYFLQLVSDFESKTAKNAAFEGIIGEQFNQSAAEALSMALLNTTEYSKVQSLMTEMGFKWDLAALVWKASAESIEATRNKIRLAFSAGEIDNETYLNLTASLNETAEAISPKTKLDNALLDMLLNYNNVSEAMRAAFINNFYQYGIKASDFLTKNDHGTYDVNVGALKSFLDSIGFEYDEAARSEIEAITDSYLSNIQTAATYSTLGASSLADIEAFRLSYADIVHESLDANAFQYNSLTQSFMLDPAAMHKYVDAQKEILTGMGYTEEFVNAYITDLTDKAILASIELDSFLNADTKKSRNDEATKLISLIESLDNYDTIKFRAAALASAEIHGIVAHNLEELLEKYNLGILEVLESGGENAVELLKMIKPNASSDELEAAFNSQINKLTDVLSLVSDLVAGEFVGTEGKLHDILARVGAVDDNGVVKAGFDMVEVYAAIYAEMSKTAGATTAGLNDAYAKLLTAQDQTNIDITEALKNGNGMSYADFGNLLAKYDIKFEDYMTEHWDTVMRDGFGNIRITDWEGFAKNIFKTNNLDAIRNTDEYISAFKAYNDGLIELNKNTEEAITEEILQIENAKAGDWFNLSELWAQYSKAFTESTDWHEYYNQGYGLDTARMMAEDAKVHNALIFDNLNTELGQWGATFENGILKFGDNANLIGIARTLEQAAEQAGLELGNGLEEIKDTVLNILGSYTQAITDGIKGGLDNFSAQDLRKKADNIGVTNLHFEQTIDGLKLSQQSAIELYQALSKVDTLLGQIVFKELSESLKESNENFTTTSSLLRHIADLTIKIKLADEKTSSARLEQYKAELEVAKEIVSVRSAAEDDSFNFMNLKIPSGQNNPLNYAKSWTQAVKSIKEAYKVYNTKDLNAGGVKRTRTGYMGYEDFYNVVNELNNMAGLGANIELAGVKLDGSLEAASELIIKGIDTLTAVDTGDMMVNIGALGISLALSGSELEKGIDTGMDAVADAEIKALDGMIAMLELIVAMEELGDVAGEDMVIELPDIVTDNKDLDKDADGLSDKFESWRDTFLKLGSKSRELAETITINGQNMVDWLSRAAEEWTADDAAVLDALYQAAISNDWNTDDVGASLQLMLNSGKFGELAEGFSIEVGDITYTVSNGVVIEAADWTTKDALDVLKLYKTRRGYGSKNDAKARAEITAIIQKYLNGEGASPYLSVEEILKIRHTTLIQKDTNGKDYIEGPDGTHYERDSSGWRAAILAEILSDLGISKKDIDINYDAGTATATTTYGIKNKVAFTITTDEKTGKVDWLLDDEELSKYIGRNRSFSSLDEVLHALYDGLKANADAGSEEAKKLVGDLDFDLFVYSHFGVHVAVLTEVYKDNEQVDNASTDKKFRDAAEEVLNYADTEIEKLAEKGSDGRGKTTITLKNGYTIVMDTDDITLDDRSYDSDLVKAKIREAMGIDEALKDTITLGILGALPSLTDALSSLEPGPAQKVADAIKEIGNNAQTAITRVASLAQNLKGLPLQKESNGSKNSGTGAGAHEPEAITGEVSIEGIEKAEQDMNSFSSTIGSLGSTVLSAATSASAAASSMASRYSQAMSDMDTKTQDAAGSTRLHMQELLLAATDAVTTVIGQLGSIPTHISVTSEFTFKTPDGKVINTKGGYREENGKITITVEGRELIQEVKDEAAEPIQMTIGATTDPAINALNELIATIESTYAEASVGLTSLPSQIQSQINSRTYTASVQLQPTGGLVPPHATGNLGLAQAKGTLMGELGPELVVSNGRYFVAGQNGAEMVNLADDAIVFNHLQTEQLLKHGMSSGRGKAVTSEKNAVAFATGNTGPAMASASAALAALKQLRAMWESLKGASISDLAGAGGGGGGGGGDKAVDPSIWIDTVERWYNLMQKIAKLEKEITHEETLRSKLESDWNANGNHYYASQKRSLEALRDLIDAQEQLNLSRLAYYDLRVEALEKSPFGKLIRFDDEGQMFFLEGAMEWLTKLAGFDSEGKANYTDEEKYDILMKAGYGDYMKYDSNGGEIKKDSDGDGEVTDDELQTFYGNATKAFWDRINDYKEATLSLWDSIKEGEDNLLDLQADLNSLLEEIRENQMEVEDEVLKAIEDLRQREIDALQDERDKLEESTLKYIDGLTDALNREQEMYLNLEDETSLNQQRRRLAILQRSGGSAEDIASLRSEIDSSERERYFNLQQQQIDAILAASDLEIERMDSLIEIMTETLEYQKEYGLLWGNVYAVMQESADKIVSFITHGNSEFWTSSELASLKAINEQLFAAEQWTSYRDDLAAAKASIGENGVTAKDISENVLLMATMTREQMKDNDYRTFDEAMKKEFGNDYDKNGTYKDIFYSEYQEHGDLTKVTASARKKYSDDKKAAEAAKKAAEATAALSSSSSGGGDGGSSGGGSSSNKSSDTTVYEYRRAEYKTQAAAVNAKAQDYNTLLALSRTPGIPPAAAASLLKAAADTKKTPIITKKKAGGGYVNHGVYELGELGTETVLTASQTKVLRDNILSNRPNSLISLLRSYNENYDGINSSLTGITPVEDNSVTIERVEMTMEVKQIANDYDAKRAGEQALNEMMRIARKTGATNSIRR